MKKTISLLLMFTLILNIFAISSFAAGVDVAEITVTQDSNASGDVKIKFSWDKDTDLLVKITKEDTNEIEYVKAFFAGGAEAGEYEVEFKKSSLEKGVTYIVSASNKNGTVEETFDIEGGGNNGGGGGFGGEEKDSNIQLADQEGKGQAQLLEAAAGVTSLKDATNTISSMAKGVDAETKKSSETAENAALVTTVMVQNVSAKKATVKNNELNLKQGMISAADLSKVDSVIEAIKDNMEKNGYMYNREIEKELTLKVNFSDQKVATIVISRSVLDALKGIDILTIVDNDFRISFRIEDLEAELAEMEDGKDFEIYIEKVDVEDEKENLVASRFDFLSESEYKYVALAAKSKGTKISFNKEKLKNNVNVSVPAKSKSNTDFQTVKNAGDQAVIGGKYNAATGMIDLEIGAGGTYVVEENRVDFKDIQNKSAAMKEAIQVLASKGIIEGVGEGNFNPDSTLTRAEFTKLVVKTLYSNQSGVGFTDTAGTWYESYAKAARTAGIINGYNDGTFRGDTVILKEHIVAIAARTLREKKKYFDPTDTEKYLSKFVDKNSIPAWAIVDVALASRENLIIERTDGLFKSGQGMTRGEAALVLKKLFDRL